jgi:hypothetical protein
MDSPSVPVTVRLIAHAQPIAGEIEDGAGRATPFHGWMELAAALEARRRAGAEERACDGS